MLKAKRVLITGATGFVGCYLSSHLEGLGCEVFATSLSKPTQAASEAKSSATAKRLHSLDVTNFENCLALIRELKPEVVYHLGAVSFVPQAEKDFQQALQVNCLGTDNLLKAIAQYLGEARAEQGASNLQEAVNCRFIFISSSEVYGAFSPAELPLTENSALRPNNNYAISKLTAEKIVERYARQKSDLGLSVVVFRPFNHIGPGQSDLFAVGSFSKQIAAIKLGQQEPKMRVGNLDVKIDFLDVRDVIRAYGLVLDRGEGVYNLSSAKSTSLREVIAILADIAGVEVEIEIDPNRYRPADRPEILGSSDRFKEQFGWQCHLTMRETLGDCLNYWLQELA
jgi:GDP-4-dehydro-6-deoxy-D-mannose reductase